MKIFLILAYLPVYRFYFDSFFSKKKLPIRYEGTVSWQGLESDGKNFGDKKEKPDILYGYNAGVVELEVNINTGQTRVLKIINASDPGTINNPQALEGQVEGAVAFGFAVVFIIALIATIFKFTTKALKVNK